MQDIARRTTRLEHTPVSDSESLVVLARKQVNAPSRSFQSCLTATCDKHQTPHADAPILSSPQERARESSISDRLFTILNQMESEQHGIDQQIRKAAYGKTFSPKEILLLQSRMYAYSQDIQILSQLMDRGVGSVKMLLNLQL